MVLSGWVMCTQHRSVFSLDLARGHTATRWVFGYLSQVRITLQPGLGCDPVEPWDSGAHVNRGCSHICVGPLLSVSRYDDGSPSVYLGLIKVCISEVVVLGCSCRLADSALMVYSLYNHSFSSGFPGGLMGGCLAD